MKTIFIPSLEKTELSGGALHYMDGIYPIGKVSFSDNLDFYSILKVFGMYDENEHRISGWGNTKYFSNIVGNILRFYQEDTDLNSPIISDIDNDGKNEIIGVDFSGKIYVWNSEGKGMENEYNEPLYDASHSNCYKCDRRFIRGDSNEDGGVDISDVIYTLSWIFQDGPGPSCEDRADANDDGYIDISDAIFTLLYLYQSEREIPAPFPNAGEDPTPDGLKC